AVPELDGSFLEKDSFPRHAVIAGGVRGFEAGDGLGGGEAANAVAGHAVHLGYLQAEQEVAREAGNQVLDQGYGAAGLILAAVKGAKEDFGIETVELAVLRDILNDADALLLVAMDSDQEAEHAVVPGEAADDIIVKALDQARIHVVRLDLTEMVVEAARAGGVPQGIAPGLLDHPIIVGAESVRDAERVERGGVVGVGVKAGLGQRHGAVDFGVEALFGGGGGFELGTAQEGVGAGDELAFEGAVAEHLLEDQGLREVVVEVGGWGVLDDGLFEAGDS